MSETYSFWHVHLSVHLWEGCLGREICNRTGRLLTESFNIGDKSIECVKQYKYLGLVIQNNGNVNEAKKKRLFHKGWKACFKLYKDVKSSCPPIKTLLHLFDHCIKLIITYGCENWGVINITPKENLFLFLIYSKIGNLRS